MQSGLKTLVIGGSGFIGSALLKALASDKSRIITVLGRSTSPRHPLPVGMHYTQGDASDQYLMKKLITQSDEIIDLAYSTVPKTSYVDPLFDVVANLPTAVNLLQIASKAKIRRYILVSSGGAVYGNTSVKKIKENHPTNPISPYGISKLVAEKYAIFFHEMNQLPVIIVRPGNPYGALQLGQTVQGFVGAAISAIRANEPVTVFGEHGTIRDYLHIEDLAFGLYSILESGVEGCTYNLGSGCGSSNLDILNILAQYARLEGFNIKINYEPDRPFDVRSNVLDSSLAFKHTGWKSSVTLHQGLARVWHESRSKITSSNLSGI